MKYQFAQPDTNTIGSEDVEVGEKRHWRQGVHRESCNRRDGGAEYSEGGDKEAGEDLTWFFSFDRLGSVSNFVETPNA
ncbi:MAG: hypothetical protein ACM3RR_00190 [Bacillota bacterium]